MIKLAYFIHFTSLLDFVICVLLKINC